MFEFTNHWRSVDHVCTASHKCSRVKFLPTPFLSFPLLLVENKRGEKIVCELAHMVNETTNQIKIKREEGWQRKAFASNEQHLSSVHAFNHILPPPPSLYFSSTSQFPSSAHAFSLYFLSLPSSFFFPVIIPLLLWDCWSPQRDCGMLEEYESNRCLITVLIAGHGETYTHIFTVTSNGRDDNSYIFLAFSRSQSSFHGWITRHE